MRIGVLNGLDLFSGIGGLTIALGHWVRPIAYCEKDRYAQAVLLSKQSAGLLPIAPIWDDVSTLTSDCITPDVEIVYGGFPCQDISSNGLKKGLEGKQSGLFFELLRVAREINAQFIFLENVPNIATRGLSKVVNSLADYGYDCRWTCVSAAEVGAPHKRKRWFLLAHTNNEYGLQSRKIPNAYGAQSRSEITTKKETNKFGDATWWTSIPGIPGVVNGLPYQLDRHRALGNAVVPQQAREAFIRLMGLTDDI